MPERANVQIDFSGGTDQRTDARHVEPGRLLSLINGVFAKGGSIRKRNGFTALSRGTFTGATVLAGTRLATFGGDLVLSDGDALYSYSPAAGKWSYKDQVSQAVATRASITHGATTFYSPDVAYGNGYAVFAWRENYNTSTGYGDVKASVIEIATGAIVLSSVTLASGQLQLYPRVVVVGTTAVVLYGTSVGTIKARTLDLTSPTAFSGTTVIISDASTDPVKAQLDACAMSDRFAVVYVNALGGASQKLQVKTFDPASLGAALASRTLADTSNPTTWNLAIRGVTGERLWIAYNSFAAGTSTIKATALNTATLADSTAPFAVSAPASVSGYPVGIERVDTANAVVTWTEQDSITNVRTSHCRAVSSAGTLIGAADHYLRRHIWLSKPFMAGSRCYALCAYAHDVFSTSSTAFLVDLTISDTGSATVLLRPVTTIAPRRSSCSPIVDVSANLCSVAAIGSTGTYVAAVVVRKSAAGKLGLDSVTLDFANRSRTMPAELGGSLHLSGGVPAIYDGGRVIENVALVSPEPPFSVTQTSNTTGAVANGTYSYAITFARYDLQGQIQRSAPSTATVVVVAGANAAVNHVDFRVAPYALTLLQDVESGFAPAWYIEVWRTTAGGSVLFKIPDAKTLWNGSSPGPILNDPTLLQTTTITDLAADSDLAGQPTLYTTGNVLENRAPPTASICVVHKDRAWLAGTDDPKILWFSQPYTFGEAPGFHDQLTITVEDGGAVTALASLDSHLVIFKRDRIFIVDGDGPGLTGGAGFSAPQRVAVDLGCIDANSVAVVPDGVVFQSSAGIYLLTRGLEIAYLSGPIEDTFAGFPIVTSVVVHETQFQIRFTCRASMASNAGVILVYDYLVKQWSTFQVYDSVAAQASTAIAGACNHGGVYKWVAPNGAVHQESATAWTDDGTWVTFSLETAWFKAAGLQGWQRSWAVQVLGESFSAHDITVKVGADYSPTYAQTKLWRNAALATMALEQVRTAIVQQKCQAIRFAINDAPPTDVNGTPTAIGSGQAFTVTGLLLEAAVLSKAKRLPAPQRG